MTSYAMKCDLVNRTCICMLLRARLAQSTDKHLVYIVESYLQIIAEEALYLVY